MGKLDVDWADLELAFRDATGTENFLDLLSGEVLSVVPGFSDEEESRDQIRKEPRRYLPLTPVDTGFARDVMRTFIQGLPAGELKGKLEAGFKKTGALTRCMELLDEDRAALASFHRFEQARFWEHVDAEVRAAGVEPQTPPPSVELFEGFEDVSGGRSSGGRSG